MKLNIVERRVRVIAAIAMLLSLSAALLGIWRGLQRLPGRATGRARSILRLPVYVLMGIPYLALCFRLWRPLRLPLSMPARAAAVGLGTLLYFPGMALYLWAWLSLGEMYNVSSGFGVQLYARHRLVTHGPYAFVRHPMYLGLLLAAFGGLLLYRTWTLVFLVANFLGLIIRARREEQALAVEFGEQWSTYCRRVPGWIPRLARR